MIHIVICIVIRHLHLKEDGLEHIENGIRVVTFTRISHAIPSVIVYRGTPLGFRYTGQPKLCFRCASAEHTVRDCPKKKTQNTHPPLKKHNPKNKNRLNKTLTLNLTTKRTGLTPLKENQTMTPTQKWPSTTLTAH